MADLPAPEETYDFKVHLVGVAQPELVHAASHHTAGGMRIFLDRDGNEVRRYPEDRVESID